MVSVDTMGIFLAAMRSTNSRLTGPWMTGWASVLIPAAMA